MRLATLLLMAMAALPPAAAPPLPPTLRATGYYDDAKTAFAPNHPLWTDGAAKRRWIHLPAGASIDKSDPDAWEFPVGTKLWKEFAFDRPVETRFIERLPDGSWRYATYLWDAAGTEARLAPEDGARVGEFQVPARADCLACHEGPKTPVLGYSRVQLAAPSAIAAKDALDHAALGYLHGNCGHCHNDNALPGTGFTLAQPGPGPAANARFRAQAVQRMRSFDPMVRMPPIGVRVPDAQGIELIQRWLKENP